jgi:hypothetical protein
MTSYAVISCLMIHWGHTKHSVATLKLICEVRNILVCDKYIIHSVFCLTTGPKPLPKRFLHIVRSRASSFKWEYPLLYMWDKYIHSEEFPVLRKCNGVYECHILWNIYPQPWIRKQVCPPKFFRITYEASRRHILEDHNLIITSVRTLNG